MSKKRSIKVLQGIAAAALCCIGMTAAQASLIGSNASCSITPVPTWDCSTASATVVDPGAEFSLVLGGGSQHFSVDIDADSLTLTWVSSGGLGMGAGEIAVFGGLSAATGVTGFLSAGESGFTLGDVSFAAGTLSLILNGSSWSPGGSATIQFATAAVPEPASLALLGLGLGLAAFGVSRRTR